MGLTRAEERGYWMERKEDFELPGNEETQNNENLPELVAEAAVAAAASSPPPPVAVAPGLAAPPSPPPLVVAPGRVRIGRLHEFGIFQYPGFFFLLKKRKKKEEMMIMVMMMMMMMARKKRRRGAMCIDCRFEKIGEGQRTEKEERREERENST